MNILSLKQMFMSGRPFGSLSLYPVMMGILAVLLAVQAIRLIWLVATPFGPMGAWQTRDVEILSAQSRLSLFNSFDPFFRSGPAGTANVVTSLQLTLFGIRMNEGSGLGSAILAGPDGVQESYAVGDEIMSGVTLNTVQFDHVIIDRGGVRESLYLDQSIPAETVGADDGGAGLPSGPAPSVADNMPSAEMIASAIDLSSRNTGDKVTGIVVSPRGEGELFRAAGFQDGDIIVSINGQPVTSASDIATLKRQIAPGAQLSLEVERGADTIPLSINLGAQ